MQNDLQQLSKERCFSFVRTCIALLGFCASAALWADGGVGDPPPCNPVGPFGVPGLQLPADQIGQWEALAVPAEWPSVKALHAALLRSGKVLVWNGGFPTGPTTTYVWDPADNAITTAQTPTNLFCAGHSPLADGRVVVIGGHRGANGAGLPDTNVFDPSTETWTRVGDMAFGRWYPTSTTLADGRILAMAGSINPATDTLPAEHAKIPEIYDPASGTWTSMLTPELQLPTYPFNFVLPDGKVLVAGPATKTYTLDIAALSWSLIATANFGSSPGSAAMYEPGKVLKLGGGNPAQDRVELLDMTVATPAWREIAPMAYPRRRPDLVLLPDGTATVIGGSTAGQNSPECAVHAAELWDPDTETWSTMASMARSRVYHSIALLLPDGRVLVAGGENENTGSENNAEIFSPPYLFRGSRPVLSAAPASLAYGETFSVTTPDALDIVSAVLIRLGSVTHNFDQNQRYVPLVFSERAGRYLDISAPANGNLAPPGHYMLFVLNAMGVPSVARIVLITANNGDLNSDGAVDISDAVRLEQIVLGRRVATALETQRGDINASGTLEIGDLVLIQRRILRN